MPPTRRGQGQWAMGHHEPLNAAERFKKDDPGLNVRERIVNRYAAAGFDSIDPTDLRGRFRWWGLYTQRRAGIPAAPSGGHLQGRSPVQPPRLPAALLALMPRPRKCNWRLGPAQR